MWGTPCESKTSMRESRAKAPRKECVKVETRKQRRKQVDSRSAFKYSCAPLFTGNFPRKQPRKILRNTCRRESQNCARERTAKAVAKACKDYRTKSLPGFRRRSYKFVNSHDFKRTVSVEFNEQCPLFDLSPDSMATTRHYQRVMPCARYPTAALGRHRPWKTCRTQSAETDAM